MERAEMLEQLAKVVDSLSRLVTVLALSTRLADAKTDEERLRLSAAIASLLDREQVGARSGLGGYNQESYAQF